MLGLFYKHFLSMIENSILLKDKKMKKLVLVAILELGVFSTVSLNAAENFNEERFRQIFNDCLKNKNKISCQKIIDMDIYPSAKQCDITVCRATGLIYKNAGHYQQAIKYFQKAVELGDAKGYVNLGSLYEDGKGVKQDYSQTIKFYKKACDSNLAEACYGVANSYYSGKKIKQDFVSAKYYYEKACNAEYAASCAMLGVLYYYGEGVKKDVSSSEFFIMKACRLGDKTSCDSYKTTKAVNLNKEHLNWLFDDCLENENVSCQRLIDSGILPSVKKCDKETCSTVGLIYKAAKHYQQAIKYYEKACKLNDEWGCGPLADFYTYGLGVEQNYNIAFKFTKKACDLNLAGACANVGISYKQGQGVRQDFVNARKYFEKACNTNDAGACNNLGVLYYQGQGVKQNRSMAKKFFDKACDLGSQVGCDNYRKLNEQGIQ